SAATWKRDVSPFPHRRNLLALCKSIEIRESVRTEHLADELALIAVKRPGGISFELHERERGLMVGPKTLKLFPPVCASHLKPPCSRNGDKAHSTPVVE